MNPKHLKSVSVTSHIALFLLLILSGGFLWGEFKTASGIGNQPNPVFIVSDAVVYQTGNTEKGKILFRDNCARCHMLDKRMTGPGLANVKSRWNDSTHLYMWIKNSSKYLETGDKYATAMFAEYNRVIMPPFSNLSDADIREILYYVDP